MRTGDNIVFIVVIDLSLLVNISNSNTVMIVVVVVIMIAIHIVILIALIVLIITTMRTGDCSARSNRSCSLSWLPGLNFGYRVLGHKVSE